MSRSVNILFLGGAKRVSIGRMFIDAGRRMGFEVKLFSYELESHVPVSVIAEIIIGLRWRDPNLLKHMHDTVTAHHNPLCRRSNRAGIPILQHLR